PRHEKPRLSVGTEPCARFDSPAPHVAGALPGVLVADAARRLLHYGRRERYDRHDRRDKGFLRLGRLYLLYQLAVCGRILKRENRYREKRAMARITRAALHLSEEEVKERMSNDPHPLYRKRWLI